MGESGQPPSPTLFTPPGKETMAATAEKAELAPQPVWTLLRNNHSLAPPRNRMTPQMTSL